MAGTKRAAGRLAWVMVAGLVAGIGAQWFVGRNVAGAATARTWTGLGLDGKFSTATNWSPNGAPGPGDSLTFPSTVAPGQKTVTNDISGLTLASITFGESGYSVSGNAVTLTGGITAGTDSTGAAGSVTLGLPLALGSNQAVDVASGWPLTLSGVVSGAANLERTGAGTLVLTTANTCTGSTTVTAGTLRTSAATGLGSSVSGTTVASGAALQVLGDITTPEPLTLNGSGGGAGALQSLSGTNQLSGTVSLESAATIGVNAGQLTVSGVVSGPAAADLARHGGPLLLTGPTALPPVVRDYLASVAGAVRQGYVYGGTVVVSEGVRLAVQDAITA